MNMFKDSKGHSIEAVQWDGDNIEEMQAFSDRIMFIITSPRPKGFTDEEWAATGNFKVIIEDEGFDNEINKGDYVVKLSEDSLLLYSKENFEKLFTEIK